MLLFERGKLSHVLIDRAYADPDITLGFEAEFYIRGISKLLMEELNKGSIHDEDSETAAKPLESSTITDLILFFFPLSVSKEERDKDNQEIVMDRLTALHRKIFPEIYRSQPLDMFTDLRGKYKMYHILGLLRVYPENGFNIDQKTASVVKKLIQDGNLLKLSAYKNLDQATYNTYVKGTQKEVFNTHISSVVKDAVYEIIAKALSGYFGEQVVYVRKVEETRKLTDGYSKWALTEDASLDYEANVDWDIIGCELIAPKAQAMEGYSNLVKMMKAINTMGSIIPGTDAYTSASTGFHINIGYGDKDFDMLKMLVLLGDEYVAKLFDRLDFNNEFGASVGTKYAPQTMASMIQNIGQKTQRDMIELLNKLSQSISLNAEDLDELIYLFQKNIPVNKYQSVNFSKMHPYHFIEIRSPGNAGYEKDFARLEQTLNRIVTIVYVATEPDVYRQEFLLKLYKTAIQKIQQWATRRDAPAQVQANQVLSKRLGVKPQDKSTGSAFRSK